MSDILYRASQSFCSNNTPAAPTCQLGDIIRDLGTWEGLEMVQHCTRSMTSHDSLKSYKALLW
jgi:hypothetical protein